MSGRRQGWWAEIPGRCAGLAALCLLVSCLTGRAAAPPAQGPRELTMDDVVRGKVGVLLGSVYDTYLNRKYPQAEVLQYKNVPDMILAVLRGKADAGFINCQAFPVLQKENPQLTVLVRDVFRNPVGVGFPREQSGLRQEFNRFLAGIRADGVYQDWYKRWFDDGNYEMPPIANSKSRGQVRIGMVSDKGLPYTILREGRLVGSDVEIAERFGAYLQKEVLYTDLEFGSLIASAVTGKVEMILSTIMITEERKKQVDFSDPYFALSACVMGVKREPEAAAAPSSFLGSVAERFESNILREKRYLLILEGLEVTAILSVFAVLLGTVLGGLICWMRMSKRSWLQSAASIYISVVRGIPVLVLLMIFFYVVFGRFQADPLLVAVLAFGINFAAYASEMFRTSIESIDRGQTEAGIAGGFTRMQTFLYIVAPQAARRALPVYQGEVITLVKMTSIVGYIAVQDLTKAGDIIRSRTFDPFFPLLLTAVLYFCLSGLMLYLLDAAARRAFSPRRRS